MQTALPCVVMRGGTSKGLYFHGRDLPEDPALRARVLLAVMGSPDPRQIDGLGGAHPLTSKVAVIGPATRPEADVDYLFLQVAVEKPEVSDAQNCGNILAGVGPFAIERGLVPGRHPRTTVRIHMVNTGGIAVAHVETPGGAVRYDGNARIDGVPGTAAPVVLDFLEVAGSSCGALLPTGSPRDRIEDTEVTCIDNGMPVVLLRAADFGKTGHEPPQALEADATLRERLEAIRLTAGRLMRLGDVARKTVPKMSLLAAPAAGGALSTRTFIPHRVHEAIGVLGAASVATGCFISGSIAHEIAPRRPGGGGERIDVEHPTGFFTVELEVATAPNGTLELRRTALLRTARTIMAGTAYIPSHVWNGKRSAEAAS